MQRTHDAMVAHLVEMLSKQSILSKCYDTLSSDEASSAARLIETEAFSTVAASASRPLTDPLSQFAQVSL